MSLPGFHVAPSRNFSGPILNRVGTPFANRKMQISATARMDTQAQRVNTTCMTPSFSLEVIFPILLNECLRIRGGVKTPPYNLPFTGAL